MSLVELSYFSDVDPDVGNSELERILESARRNNTSRGVSGALLFNHRFFVQVLEGSPEAVNETFRRIQLDVRHSQVTLASYREIDVRRFAGWDMGYLPESSLTVDLIQKYSASKRFDPRSMSAAALTGLLSELTARVVSVA